MKNQERMTAAFAYIMQHLDGNEFAMLDLGEDCHQYGEQARQDHQHV
jgi:hypothetical protein